MNELLWGAPINGTFANMIDTINMAKQNITRFHKPATTVFLCKTGKTNTSGINSGVSYSLDSRYWNTVSRLILFNVHTVSDKLKQ